MNVKSTAQYVLPREQTHGYQSPCGTKSVDSNAAYKRSKTRQHMILPNRLPQATSYFFWTMHGQTKTGEERRK